MNNYNTRISELKGYGILLVVIGHAVISPTHGYSLRNFIYLFHLAIFYYASGYLFKDKYADEPISYFKRRIKSLYVPYVVYGSIFIFFHDLCCKIGLYPISEIYKKGDILHHLLSLVKFNYFEALTGVFWFFKSRCVDMNQGENWIWLFSDDDVMEPRCVEEFYQTVKAHPEAGLVHFNLLKLENCTGKLYDLQKFPAYCPAKMYLDEKVRGHFISMVVEFVTRRDVYEKTGGFQNFDMAWGSDFCSWVKFSHAAGGIWTCPTSKVHWRESNENISPDTSNKTVYRKMNSVIKDVKWLTDFTRHQGYGKTWLYGKFAIGEIRRNKKRLTKSQYGELVNTYELVNGWPLPIRWLTKILFYI